MGRSESGTDAYPEGLYVELPEHDASVAPFYLDTFEVTVGRLRAFVDAYEAWRQTGYPTESAGAHPLIPNSGWDAQWDGNLPSDRSQLEAQLACRPGEATWTTLPGPNENMPANCANWYVSFAFCIWDGGRLPTEAEWEFAAAGGGENRLYPWGNDAVVQLAHAVYGESEDSAFVAVGTKPAGVGRWGHLDLGGSRAEWVRDAATAEWYSGEGATCENCADLGTDGPRSHRGGAYGSGNESLRAADRSGDLPEADSSWNGIRCARDS